MSSRTQSHKKRHAAYRNNHALQSHRQQSCTLTLHVHTATHAPASHSARARSCCVIQEDDATSIGCHGITTSQQSLLFIFKLKIGYYKAQNSDHCENLPQKPLDDTLSHTPRDLEGLNSKFKNGARHTRAALPFLKRTLLCGPCRHRL